MVVSDGGRGMGDVSLDEDSMVWVKGDREGMYSRVLCRDILMYSLPVQPSSHADALGESKELPSSHEATDDIRVHERLGRYLYLPRTNPYGIEVANAETTEDTRMVSIWIRTAVGSTIVKPYKPDSRLISAQRGCYESCSCFDTGKP